MPRGHLASCALLQTPCEFTRSYNIRFDTQRRQSRILRRTRWSCTSKLPLLNTLDPDYSTRVKSPGIANSKGRPFPPLTLSVFVTCHLVFVLNWVFDLDGRRRLLVSSLRFRIPSGQWDRRIINPLKIRSSKQQKTSKSQSLSRLKPEINLRVFGQAA